MITSIMYKNINNKNKIVKSKTLLIKKKMIVVVVNRKLMCLPKSKSE